MIKKLKPFVTKLFKPLALFLKDVNPNIITLLGIIAPVLFFVFMIYHMYFWASVAYVGICFDFLDGMVARINNKTSEFGAFLDSTLDRIADALFISAFAFAGVASWNIIFPLILISFLISYARSRIEAASHNILKADVGIIERPERLLLLFIAFLGIVFFKSVSFLGMNFSDIILLMLLFLSAITFLQRVFFAYKKLK